MVVELAIGDAYGAGFEYAPTLFVKTHNDLSRYLQHPRHTILPGCYTDDTQMSIAIAEAILSTEPWTPQRLATLFVNAFRRDPREGYASGFYAFLQEVQNGDEFLAKIRPDSDKSGAAMRAGPIGIYPTIDEVIQRATNQAEITHNTLGGKQSAIAAALMTHYFLYDLGPKAHLGDFLQTYVAGPWIKPWRGKVGSPGVESVHAAVTAVLTHDSLSAILQSCIAFTGDVDTVATVALCAASCAKEVTQDLPQSLYDHLEDGTYGRPYLQQLDQQLLQKLGRSAWI
jgi:ADP-ribosyl-[dinitrogen reductase] hydrolase